MTREKVYKAIDSEREYQNLKWTPEVLTNLRNHSFEDWFVYIEDYVQEAKHILTREAKPGCDIKAREIMRKVAGLAVAALEQHGATIRFIPPTLKSK